MSANMTLFVELYRIAYALRNAKNPAGDLLFEKLDKWEVARKREDRQMWNYFDDVKHTPLDMVDPPPPPPEDVWMADDP